MHESYFGKWTEETQLQIRERDLNQRRTDMNGTIFKFLTNYEVFTNGTITISSFNKLLIVMISVKCQIFC